MLLMALSLVPRLPAVAAEPTRSSGVHAIWVWNSAKIVGDKGELTRLISALTAIGGTDVYLYLAAADYAAMTPQLVRTIGGLTRAGIRVWGLDGSRAYFHDASGPAGLYAAAGALITFNRQHAGEALFSGFISDIEPQDGQRPDYPNHFHNGLPDSLLSTHDASERLELMDDWVVIHQTLHREMQAAGLQYGAAFPSWTDDYYGEPIHVVVDGDRQRITGILMATVEDYIVMSYSTVPDHAVNLILGKLGYVDRLGHEAPLVIGALETHHGVGRSISYGDDQEKATKSTVLADIRTIAQTLSQDIRFGGVDIHDWVGWSALSP
jgi:hypothetical protein